MSEGRKIDHVSEIRAFIMGGNATFTLKSLVSGRHLTYKVALAKDKEDFFFIGVLSGSDNENDYRYLGTISVGRASALEYRWGRKSTIASDAQSAKTAAWFFHHLNRGQLPPSVEFWHAGKCCACGRKLTDPESIASGWGPICRDKM